MVTNGSKCELGLSFKGRMCEEKGFGWQHCSGIMRHCKNALLLIITVTSCVIFYPFSFNMSHRSIVYYGEFFLCLKIPSTVCLFEGTPHNYCYCCRSERRTNQQIYLISFHLDGQMSKMRIYRVMAMLKLKLETGPRYSLPYVADVD